MSIAYYNGKFFKFENAVVPLTDRSIFFGDAVYDALIGRRGRLFLDDEHFLRLIGNARRLDIPFRLSADELRSISYNVVKRSGLSEYFLYVQVGRTADERAHAYPDAQGASLLITVSPFSLPDREKRLKLISTPDNRYGYCDVKTVNLLPAVLASKRAQRLGCDEAVFVKDGCVTECAHSNVSIIKDGRLITHPNCEKILPGIAKGRLLRACAELSVPTEERPFTLTELFECDEAIVTSTTKICLAAASLDGVTIGGKGAPILEKLRDFLFAEYTNWTM